MGEWGRLRESERARGEILRERRDWHKREERLA